MSVSLEMVDTQRVSLNIDKNCSDTYQVDNQYQPASFIDDKRVEHAELKVDDSCDIPPDDPNSI